MIKEKVNSRTYLFVIILFVTAIALPFLSSAAQSKTRYQYVDSIISVANSRPRDSVKVYLLESIALQMSSINPEKGLLYANQAIDLARELKLTKREAASLSILAINQSANSNFAEAIINHKRAIAIYDSLRYERGVAAVNSNLGQVYLKIADYKNALKCNLEALEIYESNGQVRNQAVSIESIANIYYELKNYQKSFDNYKQAITIYQDNALTTDKVRCLSNQARALMKLGRFDDALEDLSQALSINLREGNLSGEVINLAVIGSVYMEIDSVDQAISYYEKGLQQSLSLGVIHSIATAHGNLGSALFAKCQENPDNPSLLTESKYHLEKGVALCDSVGYVGPMIEFSQSLIKAHQISDDYEKAFDLLFKVKRLQDSLLTHNSNQEIVGLETKRMLDLKEKDLIISKNNLEIARLDDKNDNLILTLIIVVLVGFLVLIFRTYQRFKLKHRKVLGEINQAQSHEFRGPVASILGLVAIYKEGADDTMKNRIIDGIDRSAKELDQVIKRIVEKSNRTK